MMVASCDRSPHSAKKVIVAACMNTRNIIVVAEGFVRTVPPDSGSLDSSSVRTSISSYVKEKKEET